MSDTYSQIYIHIIFAVQGRMSLIKSAWQEELYKYISGIITNKGQKLLAINGIEDHIHIFIGMKPDCCLSDLVREIKKSSNSFIRLKHFSSGVFNWQKGFGAFSYSRSQIDRVVKYISNQKQHHKKVSFKDEYVKLLNSFSVEYKSEHLFDWIRTS